MDISKSLIWKIWTRKSVYFLFLLSVYQNVYDLWTMQLFYFVILLYSIMFLEVYLFTDLFMQVTLSEIKIILYIYIIKMFMIYEQCNYSILLLLYDFEMENVEIKQTWKLEKIDIEVSL